MAEPLLPEPAQSDECDCWACTDGLEVCGRGGRLTLVGYEAFVELRSQHTQLRASLAAAEAAWREERIAIDRSGHIYTYDSTWTLPEGHTRLYSRRSVITGEPTDA